ncbi:MAG: UDP-2,3-diacylglucosamine diphosphatase [Alphaproteobacteria bacterium]|nr:UDP-2,3-diacylglucosamine diphosphatase [Alphaproteobacteria bacterium SS10]
MNANTLSGQDPAIAAEIGETRSVWISDLHLGTKGAKAEAVLQFLNNLDGVERLYLVGDIVDGWQLRKRWYWPESHEAVMARIRDMATAGTEIVYLPGNHDDYLRRFQRDPNGLLVADEYVHEAADGRRYLILHGDQFDLIVRYAKWLAHLGDRAYVFLLWFNRWFETGRRQMQASARWSLSAYLKGQVKSAVEYVSRYRKALKLIAKDRQVDGVICGHIHRPEIRDLGGVLYCNDGDWVESCTALVERPDGQMDLIRWHEVLKQAAKRSEQLAA